MEAQEYVVRGDEAGRRLDQVLAARTAGVSRTRIQAWIREERVQVDGAPARPSLVLEEGQRIRVDLPEPAPPRLDAVPIPLDVRFEDEALVVIDKPAGLQVHPGAGAPRPTLAHALLHRYPGWDPPGSPERPGIVHRLDRDTSGLLVVARSAPAYQSLVKQVERRELTRRYVALAWGSPALEAGQVRAAIGRDVRDRRKMAVRETGRPAVTEWRVLRRFDDLTLFEVRLETGRTHQIRVHLAHIGHPIFADASYGQMRERLDRVPPARRAHLLSLGRRLNRQALHAYHLALRHPASGVGLRFEAPVPDDLDAVLVDLSA